MIENTRLTLQFVETLGEYRDLSIEEWNFKELLKTHLLSLLKQQRIYWKQRGSIKWVKFGDAGTRFFHANATIRHRGNLITELTSSDGVSVTDHREKEEILWEDFKVRLGSSRFENFHISPGFFLQRNDNLGILETPFSHLEIDSIIKALPNDKSPAQTVSTMNS